MGKKQRDCAGCGAPVGIIGREHCCRCEAKIREAAAKAACSGCGKQRVLQDATGRCVLCSRTCTRCGHPVRRSDTALCRDCRRKARQQAAQQPCPRCGRSGYLRETTGWCGPCSRPRLEKDPPRQCAHCGQVKQRERVTVVDSTGDSGAAGGACPPETGSSAAKGVDLPASDPLTLAVGGTSLQVSPATGAYVGETAWNTSSSAGGPDAGGGGFSRLFSRPAYQDGIAGIGAARGVPDVAADADPDTGMAIAFSDGGGRYVLFGGGGTSVAAPLWAAVIALADQYAGRHLGFVNPALYQIGRSPPYHQAFHDVSTGTNTVETGVRTITGYRAAPGWDPVTGWGSPNAQVLVPLLARSAGP